MSRSCGSSSASEVRWQIASTVPTDICRPKRSFASSAMSRREMRLRALIVTAAAWAREPKAEAPSPAGSSAVVLARQRGQRRRWVRCSVSRTASAAALPPGGGRTEEGRRSEEPKPCPQRRQALG